MSGNLVEVSDGNLKTLISQNTSLIVDCWAPWCGPCHMLSPIFEELSQEFTNIKFGKLNVDENEGASSEYGIMSIPTMLVFKNGQLVDKWIGALPKPLLKDKINEVLGK
ncbi:MAG: thioredoxin [Candidatus Coatesbacteria bacterium]|nr:thioredoxin [Candidatus Coatesbacteria bacterium]